jgi:Ca2+-binding EF-hand superfamily protein
MGAGNSWMMVQQRPSPAKMAESLFSKLDTSGKGYIEKGELQSALNQISGSGNAGSVAGAKNGASADEIFQKLDGNSDGKITKNEMASGIEKLAASLNSQFNQMRMDSSLNDGQGGMRPPGGMPPPQGGGPDLTKEQLTSMSSTLASTDSQRASQMSNIAQNFAAADVNSDGKVSFQEAQAYDQTHQKTASSSNGAVKNSSSNTDERILKQMFDLFQTYGNSNSSSSGSNVSAFA